MANSNIHSHARPRRVRAPSERAQGLDPEVTAQPRPLSDDLVGYLVASDENDLSIRPEDLGSHFLSEAVQQGELAGHDVAELELALLDEQEDSDTAPSTVAELEVWSRMLDLAAEGGSDLSEPMREAADYGADSLDAERLLQRDSTPSISARWDHSVIREISLLDREGTSADETIAPEVDFEDSGRHARSHARGALGQQVGDSDRIGGAYDGAEPKGPTRRKRIKRAATAKLKNAAGKAAGKIRGLATRIKRAAAH